LLDFASDATAAADVMNEESFGEARLDGVGSAMDDEESEDSEDLDATAEADALEGIHVS
jgi:hypothetical protein